MPTGQHRRSIRGVRWNDTGRTTTNAETDESKAAMARRILDLRSILYEIRRSLENKPDDWQSVVKRIDATLGAREWSIYQWLV